MKIYLTHIGIMALKHTPFLSLPETYPSIISIRLMPNKYLKISVSPLGLMFANDILAGVYGDNYTPGGAETVAKSHNAEILAVVEFIRFKAY